MYSSVRDLTRSRLGATSISPLAAAVRINGLEWHSASSAYQPELIKIYYKHDYLARGKTFAQALDEGPLRAAMSDVGLLRKFEINVTIMTEEVFTGKGPKPWRAASAGQKRIRVAIDPEWAPWHDSLLAKLATHSGDSSSDVDFYDQAARKKLSADKAELAKELLYARGTGVYAVLIKKKQVSKTTTFGIMSQLGEAVKREIPAYKPRQRKPVFPDPVAAPIGSEAGALAASAIAKRSAAGRKVAPVSAKPPKKPLVPIASRLTERISAELTKLTALEASKNGSSTHDSYKSVKRVMKEPTALVHAAVHTAITDDKLYTGAEGAGAKGASDYWRKRKVNIGDLINKISRNVAEQVGELNAEGMFAVPKTAASTQGGSVSIGDAIAGTTASVRAQQQKKPEFSHDIARKAFTAATINCGIWDSFLDMVGYNGTHDDGGNDLGPCASFGECSKVHGCNGLAHACQPEVPLCAPRVHVVPSHKGHVVPHHRHHRWAHGGHQHHHRNDDVVFQSVVVDLTEKHKNPHKLHGGNKLASFSASSGVVHVHDDSSSDEEEHTMTRAIRRKSGKPFRSVSSPDDSDGSDDDSIAVVAPGVFLGGGSSVAVAASTKTVTKTTVVAGASMNEATYSNFLTVLKRSGRVLDKPCVVMCLPNSILTAKNMEVFERHGGDTACAVFVDHYVCHTRGPVHAFADLIDKTANKVVLVSETAVCWAIHTPSHVLAVADRFAHEIAHPRRCVKPVLMHCRGYPEYVQFMQVDVLHKYMPRNV
jgi:hypothetical protein